MSRLHQEDGEPERNVVWLVEATRLLVETLTTKLVQEQDRRFAAAVEALAAAEEALENEYQQRTLMECRLRDWEVPPLCDCGRSGYEVWCRCGKRLK
jgi:hypothetical protein